MRLRVSSTRPATCWFKNNVTGKETRFRGLGPGTVIDAPEGISYEAPITSIDAGNYVRVLQAELRAAAQRLVMPEYMFTADSSNANFSSTLVAESPAVKNFERLQAFFGRELRQVVWSALRHEVFWGRLPEASLTEYELRPAFPSLIVRDQLQEAQRRAIMVNNGVLSRITWRRMDKLNDATEERHITQENMRGYTDLRTMAGGDMNPGGSDRAGNLDDPESAPTQTEGHLVPLGGVHGIHRGVASVPNLPPEPGMVGTGYGGTIAPHFHWFTLDSSETTPPAGEPEGHTHTFELGATQTLPGGADGHTHPMPATLSLMARESKRSQEQLQKLLDATQTRKVEDAEAQGFVAGFGAHGFMESLKQQGDALLSQHRAFTDSLSEFREQVAATPAPVVNVDVQVPDMPPPVVTVAPPVVNVAPPVVNVAAPEVTVLPQINVPQPQLPPRRLRVKRNAAGDIMGVEVTEGEDGEPQDPAPRLRTKWAPRAG